ncbi:MAG: dihydrolipoamide acyltransferase, partial [Rikenellaceae bacterium]|nr:dihydrolipoamide acyltransferase [Rikenellaceae bacterium]
AVAPALPEDQTTVGSLMNASHLKPTAVGDTVTATATLVAVEGRKLTYRVEAHDSEGLIGEGDHVRYIVGREKFLAKLKK